MDIFFLNMIETLLVNSINNTAPFEAAYGGAKLGGTVLWKEATNNSKGWPSIWGYKNQQAHGPPTGSSTIFPEWHRYSLLLVIFFEWYRYSLLLVSNIS